MVVPQESFCALVAGMEAALAALNQTPAPGAQVSVKMLPENSHFRAEPAVGLLRRSRNIAVAESWAASSDLRFGLQMQSLFECLVWTAVA